MAVVGTETLLEDRIRPEGWLYEDINFLGILA